MVEAVLLPCRGGFRRVGHSPTEPTRYETFEDRRYTLLLMEAVKEYKKRNNIKSTAGRGAARPVIIEFEVDRILEAIDNDTNEDKTLDQCYAVSIVDPVTVRRWTRQVRNNEPLTKEETAVERDHKIRLYNKVKERKEADHFLSSHWDEVESKGSLSELRQELVELKRSDAGERVDNVTGDRKIYGYAQDLEHRFSLRLPMSDFHRYSE